MQAAETLQAILFNLDGVLIDSETLHNEAAAAGAVCASFAASAAQLRSSIFSA